MYDEVPYSFSKSIQLTLLFFSRIIMLEFRKKKKCFPSVSPSNSFFHHRPLCNSRIHSFKVLVLQFQKSEFVTVLFTGGDSHWPSTQSLIAYTIFKMYKLQQKNHVKRNIYTLRRPTCFYPYNIFNFFFFFFFFFFLAVLPACSSSWARH